MKRAAGADEDITAEVYRCMLLARGFRVTAGLRWSFGLGRPNQVAMDHDILLDHALAGKNDVSASGNGGSSANFVSCFLRKSLANGMLLESEFRTVSIYSPRTEGLGGIARRPC